MAQSIAELMKKIPDAFDSERAHGLDVVVHLKITGVEAGEWNATIRDGVCQLAQGIPRSKPDISIAADTSDFRRVALGELDPGAAVMQGTLRVIGDVALAQRLLGLLRLA